MIIVVGIFLIAILFFLGFVFLPKKESAPRFFVAIVGVFFLVLSLFGAWGMGDLGGQGHPAQFSQLAERTIYRVGPSAGTEGVFWVSSRKDEPRIYGDIPAALRRQGVRFLILDDKIIVVKREVKILPKK